MISDNFPPHIATLFAKALCFSCYFHFSAFSVRPRRSRFPDAFFAIYLHSQTICRLILIRYIHTLLTIIFRTVNLLDDLFLQLTASNSPENKKKAFDRMTEKAFFQILIFTDRAVLSESVR